MDDATRQEIEKLATKTLRDAGISGPPVSIERILEHLRLHRDFYDLQNPSFLDKAKHRLRVDGHKLIDVIKKIKLVAVLLFDEQRMVIDSALPKAKQNWPSLHEATHRILYWHRPYFFGDTAQTLDPDWQETLESEANYGTGELMFHGSQFTSDALQTALKWESVQKLAGRYKTNLQPTLRRFVERGHQHAMAMLVSKPYWKELRADQTRRWRHFIPSVLFAEQFSSVNAEALTRHVDTNSSPRRGGPVADFSFGLRDDVGDLHEFRGESFYNAHDVLTLFVRLKTITGRRIVVPGLVGVDS